MEIIVKHFSELTARELHSIYKLRVAVFVVEQNCPYQDVDDLDLDAIHVMLWDREELVGYVRVLSQGSMFPDAAAIGRVIAAKRRMGIGSKVMQAGIATVEERYGRIPIKIEAQCYAVPFYENLGFKTISDEFLEDGIPHVVMLRSPQ